MSMRGTAWARPAAAVATLVAALLLGLSACSASGQASGPPRTASPAVLGSATSSGTAAGSVTTTASTGSGSASAITSETATPLDPSSTWLLVLTRHLELVRDDGTGRHVAFPAVDEAGRVREVGLADWSPDGTQITFTEIVRPSRPGDPVRGYLWVGRSDGSGARKVFPCGSSCTARVAPTFSPDGKRLAFAWARNDAQGEWVTGGVAIGDLATGRVRTVFESASAADGVDLVRWSGDGRRLVLSLIASKSTQADAPAVSARVAVINASGPPTQRPRNLTPTALDAGLADWDPRSGRIAYATNILEQRGQMPTGDANVYTMAADGSDVRAVTAIKGADGFATQPSWTPDGRIVFANCVGRGLCFVGFVDADGSHLELPQQVTGEGPQVKPKGP